jgi:hypothetical protein
VLVHRVDSERSPSTSNVLGSRHTLPASRLPSMNGRPRSGMPVVTVAKVSWNAPGPTRRKGCRCSGANERQCGENHTRSLRTFSWLRPCACSPWLPLPRLALNSASSAWPLGRACLPSSRVPHARPSRVRAVVAAGGGCRARRVNVRRAPARIDAPMHAGAMIVGCWGVAARVLSAPRARRKWSSDHRPGALYPPWQVIIPAPQTRFKNPITSSRASAPATPNLPAKRDTSSGTAIPPASDRHR